MGRLAAIVHPREIPLFPNIGYHDQRFGETAPFRLAQRHCRNFPMFRFRAAPMPGGPFPQGLHQKIFNPSHQ